MLVGCVQDFRGKIWPDSLLRWTPPLRWDAQNFAFFFPLPPQFSFFLLSFWFPFVEFWGEAPGPSNVHVWALGLSCERPRRFKHPQEFNGKTPKREKKERKLWREREKNAKFWAPPPFGAPSNPPSPPSSPLLQGLGPHPWAPPFSTIPTHTIGAPPHP